MLKQFIGKVHNYNQLIGWLVIKVLVTYTVLTKAQSLKSTGDSTELSIPIYMAQIFQTIQCLDILFIILKISHGSFLGTIAQQLGRMVVVYYFMEVSSSPFRVIGVLIPWSLAEVNRYSYYLFKNPITTWLRYNAFIILYPLGVYGEMALINDYIHRHSSTLSQQDITCIRVIQGVILVGFVFLFLYLFKSRSAKNNAKPKETKKNLRSSSPLKRD